MNLREFIGNALVQINQGVKDAQDNALANGGVVNPRAVEMRGRYDPQSGVVASNGELIRDVQFDVVVTVAEGAGEGLIDASADVLEVVPPHECLAANGGVSRIRFRVPVSLPAGD